MFEILSLILFGIVFYSLLHMVLILRPIPLCGALPLAFAGFIGLESIVLNVLSQLNYVTSPGVLITHLGLIIIWAIFTLKQNNSPTPRYLISRIANSLCRIAKKPAFIYLAPFVFILFLTILMNAPTTWDSLTYHMARVVHWMNNGSVDYYHTSISRQNEMTPGAEYVILFFQLLTNDDILAGFPQFFSFLLIPCALYYMLRVLRVSRGLIFYLILLTMSAPMAILQATTTQNDLVCSLMTFAIIISSARLIVGNINRLSIRDYFLLGLSIGAGFLVKPIAVIIASPFLLVGIVVQLRSIKRFFESIRRNAVGLLVMIGVIAITAGPDVIRKMSHDVSRNEVYPLFSEWTLERLLNPLRIMAQNFPWPLKFTSLIQGLGYNGNLFTLQIFNNHHDFIGNPIQMLLLVFFTFITLCLSPLALKKSSKRHHLLLISFAPAFAWIVFSFLVRDQPWIARLQLPLFLVLPFSMFYISSLIKERAGLAMWFLRGIMVVTIFSMAYGGLAGSRNPDRPLPLKAFWGQQERKIRYDYDRHNDLIAEAKQRNCSRVGLLLGGDVADYPLTWRSRQQGITVRHINFNDIDDWPCMIYTELDGGNKIQAEEYNWVRKDEYSWHRDLAYEFNRSSNTCLESSTPDQLMKLEPLQSHKLTIQKTSNGIKMIAAGDDPALLLPGVKCADTARSAIIELLIESPVDTKIQLFHRTAAKPDFCEGQSQSQDLEEGMNRLYFLVPINEVQGAIRLDIGCQPNVYFLYSVIARSVVDDSIERK